MCTGEPAHSKCTWTCHKIRTILCGNLHGKCRTRRPRSSFCSSLRSRNGHGHVRRAILIILCRNKEMSDASPAAIVLCEPAQSTCTWTDTSQEPFCAEIYRGNAWRVGRDTRFVRASAVKMLMDMSQEPFCSEIYGGLAAHGCYHLDSTPDRKNPSVWTHCSENKT